MSVGLVSLNGPHEGQKIDLDPKLSEILLGRSADAQISIDNKNISRKHAKLKQDIDGIWIEDLGSKNGVWVNGQKITEPVLLQDSDEIDLGDLKFRFTDSNAAILKRLSVIPAFQESLLNMPEQAKAVETPASVPSAPQKPPSPWLDYIYIALMIFVLLGLLTGALLWFF